MRKDAAALGFKDPEDLIKAARKRSPGLVLEWVGCPGSFGLRVLI